MRSSNVISCKAFSKPLYYFAVFLASWGKRLTALIFVRFLKCQAESKANPLWFETVKARLFTARVQNGVYTHTQLWVLLRQPEVVICLLGLSNLGCLNTREVSHHKNLDRETLVSLFCQLQEQNKTTVQSSYDPCLIHNF